ncbi:flagellar hook-associated protein FlgL [Leifsonia xyli]|nr:flagellar hook-associated protein FlgL [Leifsonia xyli]
MTMRVTSTTQLLSTQRNLQASKASMGDLYQEGTSGVKIAKPSDDPAGVANLLAVRKQISQNAQYKSNVNDGTGWMKTVDSALTGSADVLSKIRDLVVQAANTGANTPADQNGIVKSIEQLKQNLLTLANTQYLGRSVFAGTSDADTAFDVKSYAFNGTPGAEVSRRVSASATIPVSADGAAIFGAGSVFALIDGITTKIAAGRNVGSELAAIDSALNVISGAQSAIGTDFAQLQQVQLQLGTDTTTLEETRSRIEDADPADVVLRLNAQQVAYQTALAVAAKSIQQTLMDYLR